ncbi:MAG: hypothetical protein WC421_06035 [Elusimicrobiales bacterium]
MHSFFGADGKCRARAGVSRGSRAGSWIVGAAAVFAAAVMFAAAARAETVITTDGSLSLDLPPGWETTLKEDDRDTVLYVKSRRFEFSVKTLNEEIGSRYVQARLKDDISMLRGRGYILSGVVEAYSIHAGGTAYYTVYNIGETGIRTGYFTYDGNTYSVLASGVGASDFEGILYSVRRAGDPPPGYTAKGRKPGRKTAVSAAGAEKPAEPAGEEVTLVARLPSAIPNAGRGERARAGSVISMPSALPEPSSPQEPAISRRSPALPAPRAAATAATAQTQALEVTSVPAAVPFVPRNPLPLWVWMLAAAMWFAAMMYSSVYAGGLAYPKLEPLPRNMPPDFFFPLMITRYVLPSVVEYAVASRPGQKVFARYERGGEALLVFSIYGFAALHIMWSAAASFNLDKSVFEALLTLPAGWVLASYPELPFMTLFAVAMVMRQVSRHRIAIMDASGSTVLEAQEDSDGIEMRDGKGMACGSVRRVNSSRSWYYCDSDGTIIFELRDEHPELHLLRRMCGSLSGKINARYGVFLKDRRAGFVLNDPSSSDKFQFHLEFGYARLAHPTHILLVMLYANARNRDYPYPWIF